MVGTYLTGRVGALVLVFTFSVLAVKLARPLDYALFSVLLAGASVANTVAGLGSQRLIPKILGLVNGLGGKKTLNLFCFVIIARILSLMVASASLFYICLTFVSPDLGLSFSNFIPFIAVALSSSLYLDVEAASQTLAQQKLSRLTTLSDVAMRCCLLIMLFHAQGSISAEELTWIVTLTQAIAASVLLWNCVRVIRNVDDEPMEPAERHELMKLGAAAYMGGLSWMATAPPVIRLAAASILSPTAIAALAFVQSLGASFQRYTPGFLILPFIEAQVMRGGQLISKEEVAARLALPWKIDLLLLLIILCGLIPLAGPLLGTLGRPEFAQFAPFLALVLLPIPTGTMYRSMEVAATYVSRYRSMAAASTISIASFFVIVTATTLSIPFMLLLALPILDNLTKCAIISRSLRKDDVDPVKNWAKVSLIFFCLSIVVLAVKFSYTSDIVFNILLGVFLLALLTILISKIDFFEQRELDILMARLPGKVGFIVKFIFRRH